MRSTRTTAPPTRRTSPAATGAGRSSPAFWETTEALAVAAAGPAPRAELRARILEAARAERQTVVAVRAAQPTPRRRCSAPSPRSPRLRRSVSVSTPSRVSNDLDDARSALAAGAEGAGGARRPDGAATSRWRRARAGSWSATTATRCWCSTRSVRRRRARRTRHGSSRASTPEAGRLFPGADGQDVVLARRHVAPGAVVAVTVEAGGRRRRSPTHAADRRSDPV